jgi:protein phosphatase
VGDVHGDIAGFRAAVATDRFVVQLGDLVDHGPDSAGVLRLMFEVMDAGRGMFLLGNHDFKLARKLLGQAVTVGPELARTLAQLDDGLRARVVAEVTRAPGWVLHGNALFVHGGFHTVMLVEPPPGMPSGGAKGVLARALFGEPTGRTQPDGFPERGLAWVDRIPPGLTVYCGHDRRSSDGRPWECTGRAGGRAVFLDTGAGKGGHLSWIDLAREA